MALLKLSSVIALCFIFGISDFATGFLIPGSSLSLRAVKPGKVNGIVSLKASAADSRRDFLLRVALLTAGTLTATSTKAFEYDAKEGDSTRSKYLEDVKSMKAARWTRQPSRIDVDRNVKKILVIRDVMVDVEDALKNNDLAAVADSIGDQSIDASKKNINLGIKIPMTQRAKPYMYGYAQLFSKKQDSPLTTELKAAADEFFTAITETRQRALAGDAEGTRATFAAANTALLRYADAIEAETLKGRLNTVRVSVGVLVGRPNPDGDVDVAAENARAVRGDRSGGGFL